MMRIWAERPRTFRERGFNYLLGAVMSAPADPGTGHNWAVALVHGIGATEPVEMIRLVTGAIKEVRPDLVLDDYTRVHEPAPASPADPASRPCPQYVRHGMIGAAKVRFATAFWSDIAVFGEGLINLLGSLMLGGMGVRYFADVSTIGRKPLAIALHWVLSAMIFLLALVFLPLAVSSLLLSLSGLIAIYLFIGDQKDFQVIFIALSTIGAATLICGIGIKKLWFTRKDRKLALPICIMVLFFSVAGSLLLLIGHPGGLDGPIAQAIRRIMIWFAESAGNSAPWRSVCASGRDEHLLRSLSCRATDFVGSACDHFDSRGSTSSVREHANPAAARAQTRPGSWLRMRDFDVGP